MRIKIKDCNYCNPLFLWNPTFVGVNPNLILPERRELQEHSLERERQNLEPGLRSECLTR